VFLFLVVFLGTPGHGVRAHEIPERVQVLGYLKLERNQIDLFLRVPLEALRDVDLAVDDTGYLNAQKAPQQLEQAAKLWLRDYLTLYQDGQPLAPGNLQAVRIAAPGDRSFSSADEAQQHLLAASGNSGKRLKSPPVRWNQGWLDIWLRYPLRNSAPNTRLALEPRLAHLGVRTLTVLHYLAPDGNTYLFRFQGNPGRVTLNPSWYSSVRIFLPLGMKHILTGWDHLLFLFCLILPISRVRPLIPVVSAFALAHSLTLMASALHLVPQALWFPTLIETLIAASIVLMALDNLLPQQASNRWKLAFGFGLIHGFGFSYALSSSMQLAGGHLLSALLSFNLGVELGQILVLIVVVGALNRLFQHYPQRRSVTLVLSVVFAHSAWHWMVDRFTALQQYRFNWPEWNLALLSHSLSWAILVILAGGLLWLCRGWFEGASAAATPRELGQKSV